MKKLTKTGQIHSIEFRPAENGIVSETAIKHKRGGQGGGPDYDIERKMGVHPDVHSAVRHLKEHFGAFKGAETAAEEKVEE